MLLYQKKRIRFTILFFKNNLSEPVDHKAQNTRTGWNNNLNILCFSE